MLYSGTIKSLLVIVIAVAVVVLVLLAGVCIVVICVVMVRKRTNTSTIESSSQSVPNGSPDKCEATMKQWKAKKTLIDDVLVLTKK